MQIIKLNDDIYGTFIVYTSSEWKFDKTTNPEKY